MQPILLLQADFSGIKDVSKKSRIIQSKPERVGVIDGHCYYDLGGNTDIKIPFDDRISESNAITIEGWIYHPSNSFSSEGAYIIGGFNGNWFSGFYLGLWVRDHTLKINNRYFESPKTKENEPIHFAYVINGSKWIVFINGVLTAQYNYSDKIPKIPFLTLGYADHSNIFRSNQASKSKLHQLIFWDGVKYTENFTPQYIDYTQPQVITNTLSSTSVLAPAEHNGIIADKVSIKGVPAERKVVLYRRADDKIIAKTWSDKAGNYRFKNLNPRTEYYVLALDYERNYNAVIQDMIRTK